MFRRRSIFHPSGINVYYFLDSDTGDSFKPNEYKLVNNAIKEGHYIEAHYSEKELLKHCVTSQLIWIGKRWFKTSTKTYRYYNPF